MEDEGKRIIKKWHAKYTAGKTTKKDASKYSCYEGGCWFSVAKVLDNNNIPLDILSIEDRDLIYKCAADGRWIDGRTMYDHFDAIILELANNNN